MSQTITNQHPAVVLRSSYNHLRVLLAIAMIAVVGLTTAVVIISNDNESGGNGASVSSPALSAPATAPGVRYDGGPEEGTVGPAGSTAPREATTGYNGGPEEGTRGPGH